MAHLVVHGSPPGVRYSLPHGHGRGSGAMVGEGTCLELEFNGRWIPGVIRWDGGEILDFEVRINCCDRFFPLSLKSNLRWPSSTDLSWPPDERSTSKSTIPGAPREPPLIPCATGELIAFFTAPPEFSSELLGAFLNQAIEHDSSVGLRLTRIVRLFR